MRLPTKGSLAETNLITILNECAESGITGMVRAESGSAIKVVYLQNGTIAYASSNDRSDRLTEVLKRAGKLTIDQIDHAQERVKPGVSLGKTLVELGFLTSKELFWGAKMQVEGIVHQLLFWKEGTYQIIQGPLPKEIVSLNISVHQIIFSGITKSSDRRWVLEQIGSPEAVYGLSEEFHLKNANYRLPIETIASRINGKRTLNEIAQAVGSDAFEVCKTIAAMETLGMAKRIKEKPVQIPLMVEDSAKAAPVEADEHSQDAPEIQGKLDAPIQDISLGEILKIPTVEQLQQESREGFADLEAVEQETSAPTPGELVQRTEADKHQEEQDLVTEPMMDSNHLIFVPERIPERRMKGILGIGTYRLTVIIATTILLAVAFLWFLSYLLGDDDKAVGSKSLNQNPAANSVSKATNNATLKEVASVSPRKLAESGQLPEAALIWKSLLMGEKAKYTLQLILACQERTVLDTMHALGNSESLMIVQADFKGQTCYRMIYGTYASEADAILARTALPESFVKRRIQAQVVPIVRILQ